MTYRHKKTGRIGTLVVIMLHGEEVEAIECLNFPSGYDIFLLNDEWEKI